MSRMRAPGAAGEQAYRIAVHLLGSGSLRVIAVVVALLVGIGWLSDSLFEWLTDLDTLAQGKAVENWWPIHRLVAVGLFTLELLALWWLARGARRRYRPRIEADARPAQARGLILFLSNLKDEQTVAAALSELTGIDDFRTRFADANWRMPLEALAYHLPRLERALVICSPQSIRQWSLFRDLSARLFPNADLVLCEIGSLHPQDRQYQGGLSFEDLATVARATDDALADLMDAGLPLADILIDITGGLKPNAVAATAVALAEGRRIQYVSGPHGPEPYRVTVYDVTYER